MNRIEGVDTFRFLAVIAIVSLHTTPFEGSQNATYITLCTLINQGARFGVPFFFIASGYFFGRKVTNAHSVIGVSTEIGKRLFQILVFWSFIYIIPYDPYLIYEKGFSGLLAVTGKDLLKIVDHPVDFLFESTADHLWFIISLGCSVFITAMILRYWPIQPLTFLVVVAAALYLFGVFAKSYGPTPFGITIDFDTRNGPFFGTAFFVTGYLLSKYTIEQKYLAYGFVVTTFGYLLHFGEIYYLHAAYQIIPSSHDYVFGTYFIGLGVALMALSNHPVLRIPFISTLGRYTLGIYAVHLVFVEMLMWVDRIVSNPVWEFGFVFLVVILSAVSTLILSKHHWLKKVVV